MPGARKTGDRRPHALLLACGVATALTSLPASADNNDDLSRLREEAAQQRRQLEGTEARIRALEGADGAARDPGAAPGESAPARPPSPLAQLKQSWSQVEKGTPQERVQALLGPPERVLHIDGALVWYYAYPDVGRGSVFFNASGKVSSRQAPSFGW